MKLLWALFGITSLAVGVVGMFLPLIPTVPLVLLAAFCFANSSEKLHNWLVSHRNFGPMIESWQARGAISTRNKQLATVSIAAVFALSLALSLPLWLLGVQAAVLSCVLIFIWTRPSA